MTIDEMFQSLESRQFYPEQKIAADRSQIVALTPMLFTWAIIYGVDETGIAGRYCYDTMWGALKAFVAWSGNQGTEPTGWIRHPESGRRRTDGDPAKEYIVP